MGCLYSIPRSDLRRSGNREMDMWNEYFEGEVDNRKSLIVDARYNDFENLGYSGNDRKMLNKSMRKDSSNVPPSERSTLQVCTEDSLVIVRSLQFLSQIENHNLLDDDTLRELFRKLEETNKPTHAAIMNAISSSGKTIGSDNHTDTTLESESTRTDTTTMTISTHIIKNISKELNSEKITPTRENMDILPLSIRNDKSSRSISNSTSNSKQVGFGESTSQKLQLSPSKYPLQASISSSLNQENFPPKQPTHQLTQSLSSNSSPRSDEESAKNINLLRASPSTFNQKLIDTMSILKSMSTNMISHKQQQSPQQKQATQRHTFSNSSGNSIINVHNINVNPISYVEPESVSSALVCPPHQQSLPQQQLDDSENSVFLSPNDVLKSAPSSRQSSMYISPSLSFRNSLSAVIPSLAPNTAFSTSASTCKGGERGSGVVFKKIKVECKGRKLPIRKQPAVDSEVIGYIRNDQVIEVSARLVLGFLELTNKQGYVNKNTKDVHWLYL